MDGLEIVRAGVGDAALLGRMHALGWRATYRGIATDAFLAGFTPEKRAAFFARILPETHNEHYLLYWQGEPAGMMAVGPSDEAAGSGELHALYLLPDCQGRGIGRAAMDFAAERLKAMGFGDMVLTVISENHRAIRFYTCYGFVPDGPEEAFDMGREVMERRYRCLLP